MTHLAENLVVTENLVFHARTKHVEVYYHFIREKALKKEIEMHQIKTDDQVTNLFTKGLNIGKHGKHESFHYQLDPLWMYIIK